MSELELFVGCYGEAKSTAIHWLKYNPITNEIDEIIAASGVDNPSYLDLDADNHRLYVISEVENGEVVSFQINREQQQLVELNRKPTKGAPCYVEINQEKKILLVANYGNGSIIAYKLDEDGAIGEQLDYIAFSETKDNQVSRIHTIRRVRDTSLYIATDIGQSKLRIFELKDNGTFQFVQTLNLPRHCGPRELTFHQKLNFFYVVNEYHNSVLVYRYNDEMTDIQMVQVLPTVPVSYTGDNHGAAIEMNEAFNEVYVSNRGHHSILTYTVEPRGGLVRKDWIKLEGEWPRHFTPTPDYNSLVVANEHTNELTIIQLKERVKVYHQHYNLDQPVCVQFYEPR